MVEKHVKPPKVVLTYNIFTSLIQIIIRSSASLYLDRCHRLIHGTFCSLAISPLFVDRVKRSLRFCQVEYDKEAISDCFVAHSRIFRQAGEGYFK